MAANQRWIYKDGYIVSMLDTRYCLEIPEKNQKKGAYVQLGQIATSRNANQLWDLDPEVHRTWLTLFLFCFHFDTTFTSLTPYT
jgi:molybdenum cofactor biosynthesis enzyme